MSIKMRTVDGHIVYKAMAINCKEYYVEHDPEGVVVRLECIAKTSKSECQMCSLINPVKPQQPGVDISKLNKNNQT